MSKLIFVLLLLSSSAFADTVEVGIKSFAPSYVRDAWKPADSGKQAVTLTLMGVNLLQNLEVVETNRYTSDVEKFSLITRSLFMATANTAIAYYLPESARSIFQHLSIGWEANAVASKLNLRVDVRF